jgi:hypothetical protein
MEKNAWSKTLILKIENEWIDFFGIFLFPFLKERVIWRKFALKIHNDCLCVCPKPIRFQLFYFSSVQCSDETLLEVIDAQESESEVRLSLWVLIGQKLDQSEISYSIFRLFGVPIKFCQRLSMSRNPNPMWNRSSEFSFLKERVTWQKFALKIHSVCLYVCPKPIRFQLQKT